jgi:hypothetical protein
MEEHIASILRIDEQAKKKSAQASGKFVCEGVAL